MQTEMQTKSLVAGVLSALFLAATVWGASALVSSGIEPAGPAPAAAVVVGR